MRLYEGFATPHAVSRMDIGGRNVTNRLRARLVCTRILANPVSSAACALTCAVVGMLCQMLLRKAGYAFHTSAESEIVRSIKEAACYVAFTPSGGEDAARAAAFTPSKFKLPDGNVIQVSGR